MILVIGMGNVEYGTQVWSGSFCYDLNRAPLPAMKLIRSIASIVCVTQYAYRCHGYIIRLCNDSAVYRIAFLLFCVQKGTTKESVTRVLIGRKRIDNLISFLRRVLSRLVISCCCSCCCEKVVAEWRPKFIINI